MCYLVIKFSVCITSNVTLVPLVRVFQKERVTVNKTSLLYPVSSFLGLERWWSMLGPGEPAGHPARVRVLIPVVGPGRLSSLAPQADVTTSESLTLEMKEA